MADDWDDLFEEIEEIQYAGPRGQEAQRLLARAEELEKGEFLRAECLRAAVWWFLVDGDHARAEQCARDAIADGGPTWVDPRSTLLEVLLETEDPGADELERELRKELDRLPNVEVMIEMVADQLAEHGRQRVAVRWFNLLLADLDPADLSDSDATLGYVLGRRSRVRRELGLPVDRFDQVAEGLDRQRAARSADEADGPGAQRVAVLWWPPREFDALAARWPDLVDGYGGSADAHRAETEQRLRAYRYSDLDIMVGAGVLADLLAFAETRGLDPHSGDTRAAYAAELGATGQATEWPPGRNAPCWCGSGTKYRRCCGAATTVQP